MALIEYDEYKQKLTALEPELEKLSAAFVTFWFHCSSLMGLVPLLIWEFLLWIKRMGGAEPPTFYSILTAWTSMKIIHLLGLLFSQ